MPTLRLRLSNESDRAIEFSASSPAELRAGCERAFVEYLTATRAEFEARGGIAALGTRREPAARLSLHVRAPGNVDDWFVPCRLNREIGSARYVSVWFTWALLAQRPPDNYTDIWDWCVCSFDHGRQVNVLARRVARCERPPAELSDNDRT